MDACDISTLGRLIYLLICTAWKAYYIEIPQ